MQKFGFGFQNPFLNETSLLTITPRQGTHEIPFKLVMNGNVTICMIVVLFFLFVFLATELKFD